MGYGGYLVKFGNYTIPNNLIKQDTFSSYLNMQDLDPWTDENGYEHRDAVELKALKVEFETKAMLTEKQFDDFSTTRESEVQIWESIILVQRVLRGHRRKEYEKDRGIHSKSVERRSTYRSDDVKGIHGPACG